MSGFIGDQPNSPYSFIQWKGTDVCMDFWCDCGTHHHIDAMFVYAVKCYECGTVWEMPCYLYPRKIKDGEKTAVFVTEPDTG